MLSRSFLLIALLMIGTLLVACGGDDGIGDRMFSNESDPASVDPGMDEPAVDHDVMDSAEDAGAESPAWQIQASSIDRRVIRSGDLELFVTDVPAAVRQARDLVTDRGGFLASSTSRTLSDDDERADLSFEVPSDVFETVMNDLRNIAYVVRVGHETTSSQDVTEEYVDLTSQLANLSATEARFVELLEEADTISEILSVENEISRIRGEIERIQGRVNYLEQRTDFSRIYVSFQPEPDDSVTVAGRHFTPGESARAAWDASMQFVGSIGNAIIVIAVFFWWGWPVLAVLGVLLIRYQRRRRAEKTVA